MEVDPRSQMPSNERPNPTFGSEGGSSAQRSGSATGKATQCKNLWETIFFPAIFVLWLGREFYSGKYGMTGSGKAWTPDLGNHFGNKSEIPENALIFSIFLLGAEIRISPESSK
ncbi:hypothetical protein AVEN_176742-1 [Araneus ventricosus]|uniref:Uncharacterized protein n=1 Tax=Araneus ventricosus TaxID=182803 RepID=A0A4Y2S1V2_ARAVE|nr:hypothetical protein AVEN_176742-1 [Araneus ventricosus]